MQNVAEYLIKANQFEIMASIAPDATIRGHYVALAAAYRDLAREREQLLAPQPVNQLALRSQDKPSSQPSE